MKYNAAEVATLQPDYLGFIFYDKSPRNFEDTIPQLPKGIKKVGVFVDEKVEIIVDKIEKHQLNVLQLHGHESPEYCKELKKHCHSALSTKSVNIDQMLNQVQHNKSIKSVLSSKVEIIKVFSIKDKFDFSELKPYEDYVDYFLFDTKGKLPGGNGYTFNWDVLKDYPSTKSYFLSGGIGLDELEKIKKFKESLASKYCYALDVNSKFEIEPGFKNIEELEKFKEQICHVERM